MDFDLPGINVRAGLATMMGNENLYRRQLLKFRHTQGPFDRLFRAAQSEPDPAVPLRLAHTLKGLAGNIGATKLQAAAAALEKACRIPSASAIESALAQTLAELAPVIHGLDRLPDDSRVGAAPPSAIDKPKVGAMLTPPGGVAGSKRCPGRRAGRRSFRRRCGIALGRRLRTRG